jgi:phosphoheptose isomerase
MDFYEVVARHFQQTMEAISLSVDQLADPLALAARLAADALVADHKIIACGTGPGAVVAQLFTTYLAIGYRQERPALPALNLAADPAILSAASGGSPAGCYARQLRAVGQPGDLLLLVEPATGGAGLQRVVAAAHERNMPVILLSISEDGELGSDLHPGDVVLPVSGAGRVTDLQLMVVGCLCELIDNNLFGNHHPE